MELLDAWMRTPEVQNGQLRVIAHISAQSTQESIELARHAAASGCDCVGWFRRAR